MADNIQQGNAAGDEFRTAPRRGLGQRIFLLHDGRTTDLLAAIRQHASTGSETNAVIGAFDALPPQDQQQILDYPRSLQSDRLAILPAAARARRETQLWPLRSAGAPT